MSRNKNNSNDKSEFVVFLDDDGRYRWKLVEPNGNVVKIDPGTAPGVRRKKGYAAIQRAVQDVLQKQFERQHSDAA